MANNGMISSYDFFKVLSNVADDFLGTIPNLEEDWVWTVRVDSDGAAEMRMAKLHYDEDAGEPNVFWLTCDLPDNVWQIYTCIDGELGVTHATIDYKGNITITDLGNIVAPFTAEFIEKILDELERCVLKNRRADHSPSAVDLVKSIMSEEEIAHADMIYEQMFGDLIDE